MKRRSPPSTTRLPPRGRRVISFFKLCAAGNDFVLLDGRSLRGASVSRARLARRLCDRRTGIGADGLLVVDRAGAGLAPRLHYLNSDGSKAFCGNGARAAAVWLHRMGLARGATSFAFDSTAGVLRARMAGADAAAVSMPDPSGLRLGLKLRLLGRTRTVHAIDTGVPHAVLEVAGLEAFPVVETGRALRRHPAFAPAGTNADFVALTPARLLLRTYERGVEDETLACGTGAVAAAAVAYALGRARPPVSVRVRSGAVLKVDFSGHDGQIRDVWLQGPARIAFTGEITL